MNPLKTNKTNKWVQQGCRKQNWHIESTYIYRH